MTTSFAARTIRTVAGRRSAAVVVAAAALATAALGAGAGPAAARGFSPVQSCTSFTGSLSSTPGLTATSKAQSMQLLGTLDGCTNQLQGIPEPGTGSLTANLTGTASTTAVSESGAFTINWPASSGFNPSNGTLSITGGSQAGYTVSGTIKSGAFTGAVVRTSYVVTSSNSARKVTQQTFVNTAPLQALRNFG
jgi:hypothetical protein